MNVGLERRVRTGVDKRLDEVFDCLTALSNDANLDDPIDDRIEARHLQVDEREGGFGKWQIPRGS